MKKFQNRLYVVITWFQLSQNTRLQSSQSQEKNVCKSWLIQSLRIWGNHVTHFNPMQVQGYYQNIYNYFIKLLLKCECIYFKVFFFSFHSSVMFFQNTWFCKIRCKGNWLEKVEVDVSEMCLFFYERTKFCEFKLETKNIHFWQRSLPRFYGSTSCKVFIQVRNKYKLTKTSTVKLQVVDCPS